MKRRTTVTAGRRRGAGRDRIIVLNAGSSTLKATLLRDGSDRPLAATTIGWGGSTGIAVDDAVSRALEALGDPSAVDLLGVGHRVVHGGPSLVDPVVIDTQTLDTIRSVTTLAPLHIPPAVAVIEAVGRRFPEVLQVACFDTAFHADLPEVAWRYPIPDSWVREDGIRRYGFHGLSVQWSAERAAVLLGRSPRATRLVVAHLGAGSSVTAVHRGRSIDTSMGFTPLEGMMMATRSGSIDPGIIFHRLRDGRHDASETEDDLVHRSGLAAVGGDDDLRVLVTRASAGDPAARLAIDMFVDRAAAAIAASMSRLPVVDAVVFTGGIGEHAGGVRARIVRRLGVVGVPSIPRAARRGDLVLSAAGAQPAVLRVAAREDLVIAGAVVRAGR